MSHRSWDVELEDGPHRVVVDFGLVSGLMSLHVDEIRVARGWRELQAAFGGARLSHTIGSHRLDAFVAQPFGGAPRFGLSLDGALLPGSDLKLAGPRVSDETWAAITLLWGGLSIYPFSQRGMGILGLLSFLAGVFGAAVVLLAPWSRWVRFTVAFMCTAGWGLVVIATALFVGALR